MKKVFLVFREYKSLFQMLWNKILQYLCVRKLTRSGPDNHDRFVTSLQFIKKFPAPFCRQNGGRVVRLITRDSHDSNSLSAGQSEGERLGDNFVTLAERSYWSGRAALSNIPANRLVERPRRVAWKRGCRSRGGAAIATSSVAHRSTKKGVCAVRVRVRDFWMAWPLAARFTWACVPLRGCTHRSRSRNDGARSNASYARPVNGHRTKWYIRYLASRIVLAAISRAVSAKCGPPIVEKRETAAILVNNVALHFPPRLSRRTTYLFNSNC